MAWSRVRADPEKRRTIAAALGIDTDRVAALESPPVRIEGRAFAGHMPDADTIGTVVVTWFASEVLLKAAADLAKDEVKRRVKQVWAVLEPELRSLLDRRDALGKPAPDDDA